MEKKRPYLPQDFTACTNRQCPARQTCWRAYPNPDAKHQSFAHFLNFVEQCAEHLDMPEPR